jgi:hypothetical protein
MDEHCYLYALGGAACRLRELGPGVDPRFPVELLRGGRLAAVLSVVGLDRFELSKLQSETVDIPWLSQVAVRHNQIVLQAAQDSPLLPLRLGTVFSSRESLLGAMTRCETVVVDFLGQLGDREEWSAKAYLPGDRPPERSCAFRPPLPAPAGGAGAGAQYLAQKRDQQQQQRAREQQLQEQIRTVEAALASRADRCCRVRILSAGLTGRKEKMVWNAAFLLPRRAKSEWLAAVEELRDRKSVV